MIKLLMKFLGAATALIVFKLFEKGILFSENVKNTRK